MRIALTAVLALALSACGQAVDPAVTDIAAAPDAAGLTRVTEEGPVRATVTLTPEEPRLGDPLTLVLSVEARADVTVEMPAFGEALGRFSILDFTPRQSIEPDGTSVASQRYTLQAPMSGRQRIPPLRIEFLDARENMNGNDEEYRELLTEELTIEISSVLPDGAVVDELRPARPALTEFRSGLLARYWPWLITLLALIGGLVWAAAAWQRRALEQARITAYDRALQRLEALEGAGLPEGEATDAWYVELSDIVRRYLEDRYGVRAPELTTEEFLQEAHRSASLSDPHRVLLSDFLERCDRVKFAAYSPQETESRDALAVARRFLGETRIVIEEDQPRLAA